MPSIYRPRRPRASPLWQIVHHAWAEFESGYERRHRPIHGPLRPDTVEVVRQFYRCGDLAAGFNRLQCPECGHEKLLAFTCKTRHFCPSCHQRKVRAVGDWIARELCFDVPHRQFVFTMPKPLRGIFRKRRKLLDHLFRISLESLRDWMRARLDLPEGRLAAVASVQTFGDYLNFHPHLHVLTACGLVDRAGRFHLLPVESIEPLAELFRHRFIAALHHEKLISEKKARQLLAWTHSGFSLDAGEKPVASHDVEGRRRLAEYLLRAPFSLEKITWNPTAEKVVYRSKRSWHTKKNYQVFTAPDFLAALVEHIPPKSQHTVRYYGLYSNKSRGLGAKAGRPRPVMPPAEPERRLALPAATAPTLFVLPPPEPKSARALRPLWRDLIRKVWGEDPLICPCCRGTMKNVGTMIRRSEVEFFLRLHGLWEGIIALPPPPCPPFDIETMEPLDVPPQWGWSDDIEPPPPDWWLGDMPDPAWQEPEFDFGDGRSLSLETSDPFPPDEVPVFRWD
ncbi:MAG: transposase [Verrucomicrobiales bacterium]|nr:transposase [Verrucomicrobiales bacterium]